MCPPLIMSTVTQQAHTCGGNSRRRWPTGRPRSRRRGRPSGPRRMLPPREARHHPICLPPLRGFFVSSSFPDSAGYKRLMSDLSLSMPTLHASQQGRTAESSEHAVERTARRQNNKQTRQWEYFHSLSRCWLPPFHLHACHPLTPCPPTFPPRQRRRPQKQNQARKGEGFGLGNIQKHAL